MDISGLNVLMIDNYDSFTYNLVQYLSELNLDVETIRNDVCSVEEIIQKKPDFIVLSPGPSTPDHAGVSLELIKKAGEHSLPLLGICLGHQSIAQAFGGMILSMSEPVHGKTSDIYHESRGIFVDIPNPLVATRYHSLILTRSSLPDCLEVTAKTADGVIMGIRHKEFLMEGLQFHPESILTKYGKDLLKNFAQMVVAK